MKQNNVFDSIEFHETFKKLECLGGLSELPIAMCVKIPCSGISQKVLKWFIESEAKSQNKCFVLQKIKKEFVISRMPDDYNPEIFYKHRLTKPKRKPRKRIVGTDPQE